ncbi:hypothetical protein [Chryseobacterium oryctis]|uniref:YhhN-like protein n=1 Tax=Chryseobacterium oryctis TaxID=2952618 RepID=A0ABT3HJK0_9FLAO|nr:hypothetical protein [Chryseobacterium oryctis]MCW3159967.1 hypothetical protein [Chryseobacterium oryctis]
MKDFYSVVLYFNNILLLICCILLIIRCKNFEKKEKWYIYYIIFLFLIEVINKLLIYVFNIENTVFLYPIYIAGEFLILTTLFIRKLNLPKYWFVFSLLLFLIFVVGRNFSMTSGVDDYAKVISNIIVICFAGSTLLQKIKSDKITNRFLLVDGLIFLYYSVSVFVFIIQHQLILLSEENYLLILTLNNILSSLLYLSLIYTVLKLKK